MTSRIFAALAALSLATVGVPASAAEDKECGNGGVAQQCPAVTRNCAKLKTDLSNGRCNTNAVRCGAGIAGATWCYGPMSIAVRGGCWGIFTVGYACDGSGPLRTADELAEAPGIVSRLGPGSTETAKSPPDQAAGKPPAWAEGSFIAFDPSAGRQVLLDIFASGAVTLRDQDGVTINTGTFKDGKVEWKDGRASRVSREQPGVSLGLGDSTSVFRFR